MNSHWAISGNRDNIFVGLRLTVGVELRRGSNSRMREDHLTDVFDVLTRDRDLNLRPDGASHRHRREQSREWQADGLSKR